MSLKSALDNTREEILQEELEIEYKKQNYEELEELTNQQISQTSDQAFKRALKDTLELTQKMIILAAKTNTEKRFEYMNKLNRSRPISHKKLIELEKEKLSQTLKHHTQSKTQQEKQEKQENNFFTEPTTIEKNFLAILARLKRFSPEEYKMVTNSVFKDNFSEGYVWIKYKTNTLKIPIDNVSNLKKHIMFQLLSNEFPEYSEKLKYVSIVFADRFRLIKSGKVLKNNTDKEVLRSAKLLFLMPDVKDVIDWLNNNLGVFKPQQAEGKKRSKRRAKKTKAKKTKAKKTKDRKRETKRKKTKI